MKLQSIILALIIGALLKSSELRGGKSRIKNPANVHIIAVGLNDTGIKKLFKLENCISDTNLFVEKIKKDAQKVSRYGSYSGSTRGRNYNNQKDPEKTAKVNIHLLLENDATNENIRNAFKKVIKESSTDDFFFFYFAGISRETKNGDTHIITYNKDGGINYDLENTNSFESLNLKELASFMNQISAKQQMIVSEAGPGKSFAQNLQSNLFELDPELALNSERNRIILTTVNFGFDSSKCNRDMGPLTYYIQNSGNIFEVFYNYHYYEYALNKTEVNCSPNDTKYYYLSQEKDYKLLLSKRNTTTFRKSRGANGESTEKVEDASANSTSKIYGLIIGTNRYNTNQNSWSDLKNPINDANAVSRLIKDRYGAEILKLYNEPRAVIKKEIIKLKQIVTENDKLFVFIAGHGHFSEDFSQGFIVATDSEGLDTDLGLESYIPMSTLNGLLDGFKCKPILTILDICYGASFELNNADLAIENYSKTKFDKGIDDFISESDKSYSRIVLASGADEVPDFWDDSLDHSPFADKLIDALQEEETFISPGKIFSYVRGNRTKPILKKFGKHEVTGDFLLKVQ